MWFNACFSPEVVIILHCTEKLSSFARVWFCHAAYTPTPYRHCSVQPVPSSWQSRADVPARYSWCHQCSWGHLPSQITANLPICSSVPGLCRQRQGTRDTRGTLLKHPNYTDPGLRSGDPSEHHWSLSLRFSLFRNCPIREIWEAAFLSGFWLKSNPWGKHICDFKPLHFQPDPFLRVAVGGIMQCSNTCESSSTAMKRGIFWNTCLQCEVAKSLG